MTINVVIRLYKNRALTQERRIAISGEDSEDAITKLATEDALKLAAGDEPHMVEFEFLDEPDRLKRFFRFGTDPRQMRKPVKL